MLVVIGVACVLYAIAGILLLHHGWKHSSDGYDSLAKTEGWPCLCYFQPKDVRNHETWILVCLTNAITLTVISLA